MRLLHLVALVPLVVACTAPAMPAPAVKPASQPVVAVAEPKPAAVAESKPAAPAKQRSQSGAELGRQFVQSLIAGDVDAANTQLSDSLNSRLRARLPVYASALAACGGSSLDVSATQDQSMTNVLVRFGSPCGRFGDVIPLLPAGAAEPSEAEKKIGGCLIAYRATNDGLRVANVACMPA
jgi:hypothetical protein